MNQSMEHYNLIVAAIDKLVYMDKKDIVLYPYGYWGIYTKRILNDRYGIKEAFLVDEKLSKINPNIKSLDYLKNIDTTKYTFLITSDNFQIYDEIRDNLKKYVNDDNIMDIYWKVNMKVDRRVESLKLISEWMRIQELSGNVAELGVYKGRFASKINYYFKDKKIYLFDTFEGFKNKIVVQQIDERMSALLDEQKDKNNYCINDNVMGMLEKFPFPDNCIVKKGFFPSTVVGIDEEFCFVSIDVDLYQGTKDGLEWFYPRMVKRGVIMIHDYNFYDCPGVKKAVDEFCIDNQIGIVCLPDEAGTAVIVK